jgi:hypothetical protein
VRAAFVEVADPHDIQGHGSRRSNRNALRSTNDDLPASVDDRLQLVLDVVAKLLQPVRIEMSRMQSVYIT